MSLVSQLNNKKSNVMSFFDDYQDDTGMADILKKLQSTIPAKDLTFKPESALVTSSYLGIMADLLFRMIIGRESFDYRQTIAFDLHEGFRFGSQKFEAPLVINVLQRICGDALRNSYRFNVLLEDRFIKSSDKSLKSVYLNYIFELTTFAVIEAFVRSDKLPKIFTENIKNLLLSHGYIDEITVEHYFNDNVCDFVGCEPRKEYSIRWVENRADNLLRENRVERAILESYLQFYDRLGADSFANELALVIDNIKKSIHSSLSGFCLLVSNGCPKNSAVVDGADFDAILKNGEKIILVDVKTIRRQITQKDIRQIIGYILLLGIDDSPKPVTHAGFYYPLTGEFIYYDIESIIKTVLPKFRTINSARNRFVMYCKRKKKPQITATGNLAAAQRKI
jgi:hypothetical protein